MGQIVCPKRQYGITTQSYSKTKNNADLLRLTLLKAKKLRCFSTKHTCFRLIHISSIYQKTFTTQFQNLPMCLSFPSVKMWLHFQQW